MSLAVVIPVYNEEKSIAVLIADLTQLLETMNVQFNLIIINDGSVDKSLAILNELAASDSRILLLNERNAGHGISLLKGYRAASEAEMVFQIDSDYQYSLDAFKDLWNERSNYDLLIAEREQKESSVSRDIISFMSRLQTKLLFGGGLRDINSPFRLMNARMLKKALNEIPANTFAPNMLISAYCIKNRLPIYTSVCHLNRDLILRKSRLSRQLFFGSVRTFSDMFKFRFNSSHNEK
ncbi:MAG: glycosyltransferase family 2 protein [Sphingobacteriales bacterium]|nr:MAG: glycosyltransferase family 2 protein [Sphingobacteriales bacterium]